MPVGALVAGTSAVSAGVGFLGAKSAAKTQANAARDAAAEQRAMFDLVRGDLSPFRSYGEGALSPLAQLLGFGGPAASADYGAYATANPDVLAGYEAYKSGAAPAEGQSWQDWGYAPGLTQDQFMRRHYEIAGQREGRGLTALTGDADPIMKALEALPGYRFARDQGIKSIQNTVGSRGQTGAQAKGIARFVTGLADSTYGEQVNRLAAAAGLGQSAAAQTGNLGVQSASNIGQALIGAGTASAAGTVGATNAVTGALGNVANYALANKFLGMYGGAGAGGGG